MSEPNPSSNRTWWFLAIGFSVFWMLYLAFFVPGRPAVLENSGMSQPADYEWPLQDLDERPVSFSSFKGKIVFLNIWATWCGPCVGEMPSIARLAQNARLQDKNIAFVCVSTDESAEAVRQFVAGKDWKMTILRAEKVPSVFYTEGIPSTFVIDADGRIAATAVGASDWSAPDVVEFLEKLATSPKPVASRPLEHGR